MYIVLLYIGQKSFEINNDKKVLTFPFVGDVGIYITQFVFIYKYKCIAIFRIITSVGVTFREEKLGLRTCVFYN